MPFQPAPNTMRVEIRFSQNGALTENVLHVVQPEGIDATALSDCAHTVDEIVKTNWLPAMHGSISFLETVVTNLSIEGGGQYVLSAGSGFSGGVGGFRLPNEVSVAARLKAAEGGRNGAGRIFWQGLADGQTTATNFIKPETATAILSAITALIEALDAIGMIVVVLSRYFNNTLRATAVTYGPVTPSMYDLEIDSQRRRKPGNGS